MLYYSHFNLKEVSNKKFKYPRSIFNPQTTKFTGLWFFFLPFSSLHRSVKEDIVWLTSLFLLYELFFPSLFDLPPLSSCGFGLHRNWLYISYLNWIICWQSPLGWQVNKGESHVHFVRSRSSLLDPSLFIFFIRQIPLNFGWSTYPPFAATG